MWLGKTSFCCDLLSKLYLCPNSNSTDLKFVDSSSVVICFQNCIFVLIATATGDSTPLTTCCDLLSKLYLCPNSNSYTLICNLGGLVVICFQNCIFVLIATAVIVSIPEPSLVVICFQNCIFVLIATA